MNCDVTGIVKYNFKILNWADHRVQMEHQKKYWMENSMGRPWFSWEENIRKESLSLLNITGWRKSVEDRNICRHTTKEARAQCGLSCYWIWGSCSLCHMNYVSLLIP